MFTGKLFENVVFIIYKDHSDLFAHCSPSLGAVHGDPLCEDGEH